MISAVAFAAVTFVKAKLSNIPQREKQSRSANSRSTRNASEVNGAESVLLGARGGSMRCKGMTVDQSKDQRDDFPKQLLRDRISWMVAHQREMMRGLLYTDRKDRTRNRHLIR